MLHAVVLVFRFDWFFKSRTPPELQRRADTLIRLIEKELEDENVSRFCWGGEMCQCLTWGRGWCPPTSQWVFCLVLLDGGAKVAALLVVALRSVCLLHA
jgi:hypothetical protein